MNQGEYIYMSGEYVYARNIFLCFNCCVYGWVYTVDNFACSV